MATTNLFENPPFAICDVFSTVFTIGKEHWKTLSLIAIFQILSIAATVVVLALITFVVAASYIASLMDTINHITGNAGGAGRFLVDYSVGFHGASRLLDGRNNYFDDMDDGIASLFTAETIAVLITIYLFWIVGLSLVTSLYTGTFYHAIGNIYTGGFPSVRESMSRGMSQMWSLYFFTLMYGLIVAVLFIFMVLLPLQTFKFGVIFLGIVFFVISLVLFGSLMTGAGPSIVVERKSATQAFGRSLELCRSFICFIFCTRFCYTGGILLLSIVFNLIFSNLPGVLAFLGHVIVTIVSTAIGPLFVFVIYMSVRIRKENVTLRDLAMEIGNNEVVSAIEMQDQDDKNSGGRSAEML